MKLQMKKVLHCEVNYYRKLIHNIHIFEMHLYMSLLKLCILHPVLLKSLSHSVKQAFVSLKQGGTLRVKLVLGVLAYEFDHL